jgi:hypothetical protein
MAGNYTGDIRVAIPVFERVLMGNSSEKVTSLVIAVLSTATLAWAGLVVWATLALTE